MRVALIIPSNIWFAPYVNIYTQILDKLCVYYDIISWNRDGSEVGIGFQLVQKPSGNRFRKLWEYYQFVNYVKKQLSSHKYNKLIVFSSQLTIFLSSYLSQYYAGRYIFDYRDLSIEQNRFFDKIFHKILSNSYANVISSPGFKKCLPSNYEYVLSHNLNIDKVNEAVEGIKNEVYDTEKINILTIGAIRDYSSNIEVIKGLANKKGFNVSFIGKGLASKKLEAFVVDKDINNVVFEGYYPKEKEIEYIKRCTFMNIFYPKIISHSTALSNRFYNSLIYKRPMIVTTNSTQGDYVEKYKLGLSLDNCDNLDEKILDWLKTNEYELFYENCNNLLIEFKQDYDKFLELVKTFVLK